MAEILSQSQLSVNQQEEIAFGKSGSGDTALIFIHGWSLDSRLWQNQVSEFSKQYQVITVVALAEDVKSAISSDR